jgi:hypothetical protein
MKEENLDEIMSAVEDAVKSAVEDKFEELADELRVAVDETLSDNVSEYFSEGIEQFLADYQFVLKDGTVVQARNKTRVMSPNKKKVFTCYGGLRVDGKTLTVQTRISSWEWLCVFETEEEAVEALKKVSAGIEQGVSLIEL